MNIQQKILQFRKEKLIAGKRADNLVYRVSKNEAIEVAKYHIQIAYLLFPLSSVIDPEFAIEQATNGVFEPIHKLISSMDTIFGVKIHPDWQEYTNKNIYY